jgi:hypothetical protein
MEEMTAASPRWRAMERAVSPVCETVAGSTKALGSLHVSTRDGFDD